MKISLHTVVIIALLTPGLTFAAKPGKSKKKRPETPPAGGAAVALKVFDKNGNQKLDADELPAVQQAFAALRKLDGNSNGEIEISEAASLSGDRSGKTGRARARLSQADKNGNRRIDPDEVSALDKMLASAPSELKSKLDPNNNGKLEASEVARLNERLGKAGKRSKKGSPPSKPAETKPAPQSSETILPAGKSDAKPEATPKTDFGK